MAEVNRFPMWLRRPSAGRGPFAVRVAIGIVTDCGRFRADRATAGSSVHRLRHGLDRHPQPFDAPSPLA
jgi:hypothetical protein